MDDVERLEAAFEQHLAEERLERLQDVWGAKDSKCGRESDLLEYLRSSCFVLSVDGDGKAAALKDLNGGQGSVFQLLVRCLSHSQLAELQQCVAEELKLLGGAG